MCELENRHFYAHTVSGGQGSDTTANLATATRGTGQTGTGWVPTKALLNFLLSFSASPALALNPKSEDQFPPVMTLLLKFSFSEKI